MSHDARLLREAVENHLNWQNRVATPFISLYRSKWAAMHEAHRRIEEGKESVRVYTIDMRRIGKYRKCYHIQPLAKKLDVYIPNYRWENSKYEYILLHRVPAKAVLDWLDF